ncbi:hypothetical protein AK812_SmicGene19925 [Symbiodinium microadriaticum]|uniref:Uncharacterized protein n=1 Tax=Symbiodinium microadriaticum TaxID=2951 RepID=A0A1Q9DRA4_SYMMI|nr:hypothetical protein AK812_SmicGene19925 [Symbiodinium microadriaticum]
MHFTNCTRRAYIVSLGTCEGPVIFLCPARVEDEKGMSKLYLIKNPFLSHPPTSVQSGVMRENDDDRAGDCFATDYRFRSAKNESKERIRNHVSFAISGSRTAVTLQWFLESHLKAHRQEHYAYQRQKNVRSMCRLIPIVRFSPSEAGTEHQCTIMQHLGYLKLGKGSSHPLLPLEMAVMKLTPRQEIKMMFQNISTGEGGPPSDFQMGIEETRAS